VIKVRDIVYDEKPLQEGVSSRNNYIGYATAVLEYLNFFNKVISELLAVNVKIDEENKALILLSSLPQSYDHIITIIFYSKKILILEEVTSTLLSNEIKKRPNQEKQKGSNLVIKR